MTYLKQPHIHFMKIDREDVIMKLVGVLPVLLVIFLPARSTGTSWSDGIPGNVYWKWLQSFAVLSKNKNMSSWNLTLMQGFTNNVIKNVIIVSFALHYSCNLFIFFWQQMSRRQDVFWYLLLECIDAIRYNDQHYVLQDSEMADSFNWLNPQRLDLYYLNENIR